MRFSAQQDLLMLKDFQRRTVDYAFERLYGDEPTTRFLVADEVGLGKTLIAKGLIARVLEHLQDTVERIDVVYVCSNAAIAAQNINRLKVTGQTSFNGGAGRLTLLPLHVKELKKNRVNFVSFTPGTSFDLKRRGGLQEERVLILRMLKEQSWNVGKGLSKLLRQNVSEENWDFHTEVWNEPFDEDLAQRFQQAVLANDDLVGRLHECCEIHRRVRKYIPADAAEESLDLVGILRHTLARCCVEALEPDLVLLDEFQRFKNLLDGEDDAALLANSLFDYQDVRTVLLSATPYKMLTLDNEEDEDHYPDFLRTLNFLHNNEAATERLQQDIREFRRTLLGRVRENGIDGKAIKDRLQSQLLKVMCRAERVGITKQLDAMMAEPEWIAPLGVDDLEQAVLADNAASAVDAGDIVEYWKSSPYLLNFLKNYELKRKVEAVAAEPSDELLSVIKQGRKKVLKREKFDQYREIDPGNARMRLLMQETVDKGLWRLLWMPASLSYTKPSGPYADVDSVTKSLIFSSWNVVPDAVATLCSYEAERRMVEQGNSDFLRSELYEKVKPLLRFAVGRDERLTGMPVCAWLLPSPVLAECVDPLALAVEEGNGSPISRNKMLAIAEERLTELLQTLPEGEPGPKSDERWYWAAPALLETGSAMIEWCEKHPFEKQGKSDDDLESRFLDHVRLFVDASKDIPLGPRPKDLARVLAEISLGAPGTCALRALKRVGGTSSDSEILSAAYRISEGMRTLFNHSETSVMLRGGAQHRSEDAYWRLALHYAIDGNLQAVLDEQVHVLVEQLGLVGHDDSVKVEKIAESLADALSIRSVPVKIDEVKVSRGKIKTEGFNARCRFALRFGDLRDDKERTIARADTVRSAFNSPFRPFVLASTSIGQEGLDFHTWCHSVVHWNLPSNPVDLEQREGRVHRYKGHAIRKNIAENYGLAGLKDWDGQGDPWEFLFDTAKRDRDESANDLVPYWVYEKGSARIERRVPILPYSREEKKLEQLKKNLALYRLVFGQPRQEDLLAYLSEQVSEADAERISNEWRICLMPI